MRTPPWLDWGFALILGLQVLTVLHFVCCGGAGCGA